MSTATNGKVKRFLVEFEGQRVFVNATDRMAALSQASERLVNLWKSKCKEGDSIPDGLATLFVFRQRAGVKESLRY